MRASTCWSGVAARQVTVNVIEVVGTVRGKPQPPRLVGKSPKDGAEILGRQERPLQDEQAQPAEFRLCCAGRLCLLVEPVRLSGCMAAKVRDVVGASQVAVELLAQLLLDEGGIGVAGSQPDLLDHLGDAMRGGGASKQRLFDSRQRTGLANSRQWHWVSLESSSPSRRCSCLW